MKFIIESHVCVILLNRQLKLIIKSYNSVVSTLTQIVLLLYFKILDDYIKKQIHIYFHHLFCKTFNLSPENSNITFYTRLTLRSIRSMA